MLDPICRVMLFALALWGTNAWPQALPFDLHINEPRDFGYTLGDKISRELLLEVNAPYRLDLDSLPPSGRLGLWLELDTPRVEHQHRDGTHHYRITLDYRLINLTESQQLITIASHPLKISDELMTRSVPITAFRFAAHRVLPTNNPNELPPQPLMPPPPLKLDGHWLWLALGLTLGFIGLGMLFWVHGLIPWLQRAHRPFARAYRDLRRQPPHSAPEAALRRLHRAFDATANGTVFYEGLESFFRTQPHFAPLRPSIEAFFSYSRQQFFDADGQAQPIDPLLLARQLRAIERQRPGP